MFIIKPQQWKNLSQFVLQNLRCIVWNSVADCPNYVSFCDVIQRKFYPLIIGGLLNTHSDFCVCGHAWVFHRGAWLVYMQSFLRVHGVTARWPRTNNERVHSFCWFLPNPFIQDLFLWHTSQEFVKTDLYPLSQGLWSLSGMPSVQPGAGR